MSEPIAFVAGATGYTGRAVVQVLRERGVDTVAHVRPDSPSRAQWEQRFAELGARVDVTGWETQALRQSFEALAPTVVFALLGTTRKRAKSEGRGAVEAYETIDYGLTMMLYEAAVASGHAPRFVYLSAAGLRETTNNPYMRVRVRVEQALREGPLPYTVARPAIITGERDEARPAEHIAARIGDGALAFAGLLGAKKVRDRYRSIDNLTLARGLVRVALDTAYEGQVVSTEELRRA